MNIEPKAGINDIEETLPGFTRKDDDHYGLSVSSLILCPDSVDPNTFKGEITVNEIVHTHVEAMDAAYASLRQFALDPEHVNIASRVNDIAWETLSKHRRLAFDAKNMASNAVSARELVMNGFKE